MKVINFNRPPIDSFKHNWHLWTVTVEMSDGTHKQGSMQGDAEHDMWAYETFEED
jgi:hypothetical protein